MTGAPASTEPATVLARAAALVGRSGGGAADPRTPPAPAGPAARVAAACAEALTLQERAARAPPGPERARLLDKACERYAAAAAEGGGGGGSGNGGGGEQGGGSDPQSSSPRPPPGALYNAAVAQSEAARAAPPGPARTTRLRAAAAAYAVALEADPTPQALNNAGLVCHELSTSAADEPASPPARAALAAGAVARFRAALRAYPLFDRAVYNLGTVLYAYATAAPAAGTASGGAAAAGGGHVAGAPAVPPPPPPPPPDPAALATAAQCVALAAALAPAADVYRRSLAAVRHLLPLPHLRAGWLLVADGRVPRTRSGADADEADARPPSSSSILASLPPSAERWRVRWCVLDGGGLRVVATGPEKGGSSAQPPPALVAAAGEGSADGAHPPPPTLPLAALGGARRVADTALPAGAAFWVPPVVGGVDEEEDGMSGVRPDPARPALLGTFFVAADEADADGWTDACVVGGRVSAGALAAALR